MGMGMGSMFRWQDGLFDGFMRGMGEGMIRRMMSGVFEMPFPVFAWPGFEGRLCNRFLRLLCTSR
jgi:hypothetical protein